MSHIRKRLKILFIVLMCLLCTGCKKNYYDSNSVGVSKDPLPPIEIMLDQVDVTMETGDRIQINAQVKNDPEGKTKLVWSTSNDAIVSVVDGIVIAKQEGEVIISAANEDSSKEAKCKIKVLPLRKAMITGNVPTQSAANVYYSIHVEFEHCNKPSVKIITDCGGGSIEGSEETQYFGNTEEQFKVVGNTTITFQITDIKKVNRIRILCFDDEELIDSKEYDINLIS